MQIYHDRSVKPLPQGFVVDMPDGSIVEASSYYLLLQAFRYRLRALDIKVPDVEIYMNGLLCQSLTKRRVGGQCRDDSTIDERVYTVIEKFDKDFSRGSHIPQTTNGADAGAWRTWHIMAYEGVLDNKNIASLIARIGCGVCRGHATTYLSRASFVDSWDPLEKFRWTVDFHSYVSRSIGKPRMTYEDALKIWSLPKVSTADK